MHSVPLVLLAALAVFPSTMGCTPPAPSAPTASDEPVTIAKTAPQVGRISIEESSMDLRLAADVKANGGIAHVTSRTTQHERKREEVLAVFDRIITKKRVTYEVLDKSELRDDVAQPVPPNPLQGHTYVLEMKAFSPTYARASGESLSAQEEAELANRQGSFGKPDAFLEGIPSSPLHVNQPTPSLADGILETFENGHDAPDIGKVSIRFAGSRDHAEGRCGVFAFALDTQLAGEPRLRIDLRGEFLLRISDGTPIDLDMRGPARMTGRQQIEGVDMQIDGVGEMHATWHARYPAR